MDRLQLSYLPVRKGYEPAKIAAAVASVGLLLMVFQLFFRYEYLSGGSAVYRIDRITHQVCRVVDGLTDCAPTKKKSFSVSTSTSLSTCTTFFLLVRLFCPLVGDSRRVFCLPLCVSR